MPGPAVYALAAVATVGAIIVFKEFVYDPHIAPLIDELNQDRRRRRHHPIAVPIGTGSSTDDDDLHHSARRKNVNKRPRRLNRRFKTDTESEDDSDIERYGPPHTPSRSNDIELDAFVKRDVQDWRHNGLSTTGTTGMRHRRNAGSSGNAVSALDESNHIIPFKPILPSQVVRTPAADTSFSAPAPVPLPRNLSPQLHVLYDSSSPTSTPASVSPSSTRVSTPLPSLQPMIPSRANSNLGVNPDNEDSKHTPSNSGFISPRRGSPVFQPRSPSEIQREIVDKSRRSPLVSRDAELPPLPPSPAIEATTLPSKVQSVAAHSPKDLASPLSLVSSAHSLEDEAIPADLQCGSPARSPRITDTVVSEDVEKALPPSPRPSTPVANPFHSNDSPRVPQSHTSLSESNADLPYSPVSTAAAPVASSSPLIPSLSQIYPQELDYERGVILLSPPSSRSESPFSVVSTGELGSFPGDDAGSPVMTFGALGQEFVGRGVIAFGRSPLAEQGTQSDSEDEMRSHCSTPVSSAPHSPASSTGSRYLSLPASAAPSVHGSPNLGLALGEFPAFVNHGATAAQSVYFDASAPGRGDPFGDPEPAQTTPRKATASLPEEAALSDWEHEDEGEYANALRASTSAGAVDYPGGSRDSQRHLIEGAAASEDEDDGVLSDSGLSDASLSSWASVGRSSSEGHGAVVDLR